MAEQPVRTVTALLLSWREGNAAALDQIVPLVYAELRRLARARLRNERGPSLQPTALVHEMYLRLVDTDGITVQSRAHFFAIAARLMRQVLVDHGRKRQSLKRGGGVTVIALDESLVTSAACAVDVLALDEALRELDSMDARVCSVVELRYFAGLDIGETAEVLDVSTATVERDWAMAKAWLSKRLSPQL